MPKLHASLVASAVMLALATTASAADKKLTIGMAVAQSGWMTAYAHNDALLVGKGDVVNRGQVISHSGRSGSVSRPQTHFEIRRDGEPQDPLRLLTRK